jgi:TonB family protein
VKKGRRQHATRARLLWALAFSITCHAAVLAVLAGWKLTDEDLARGRVIVVALVGDGDSGGESGENGADGSARDTEAADPPADPDVAAPQVASREEPVRERERRQPMPVTKAEARRRTDRSRSIVGESTSGATPAAEDGGAPTGGQAEASAGAGLDGGAAGGGGSGESGDGTDRPGAGGGSGDLRASCRSCPTPEYPARARRQGWQGTVDVQVRVGSDGVVEQAEVGRSSGFALLDAAAVTVARQSRFSVSSGGGLRGRLRYRFILEETAGSPL